MTAMTFGHRLKELRQARGLNQAEVGFGRYSASYVSLLERGLRKPNPEVVRFPERPPRGGTGAVHAGGLSSARRLSTTS